MIERTISGLHAHIFSLIEHIEMQRTSILDIGCGTGAWLVRVKTLGFSRMVGVDYVRPDPVVGMDLQQFDINHGEPAQLGVFDVVTCIEVIEHIENIGNLLDLIKQTLHQNGIALISTPNIESLRARIRALGSGKTPSFDSKSDPTHLCPILHDSLLKMLDRRRLCIAQVYQYPTSPSKSMMFGRPVSLIANALRLLLPDHLYGDNVIYIVKHA